MQASHAASPARSYGSDSARGLSLLEMLVVIALAGILAALAWPAWTSHLREVRRLDAQQALQTLHLAQTRWRSQHGHYAPTLQALGIPDVSPDGHYRLKMEPADPEGYTLLASGVGSQVQDHGCNPMRLQLRQRATLVQDGGPDHNPRCWR